MSRVRRIKATLLSAEQGPARRLGYVVHRRELSATPQVLIVQVVEALVVYKGVPLIVDT